MFAGLLKTLHAPVYARRVEVLSGLICESLRPGDRVLDVGCGSGALGRAVLERPGRPDGVTVEGLESSPRSGAAIPVTTYEGGRFPFPDGSFDVVVLADVLHHEKDPGALLAECRRVSARLLIVKDHKIEGLFARARISFIDWAANLPYGVPCLFRYLTRGQWNGFADGRGLEVLRRDDSMDLYPPGLNLLFGRKLQIYLVLRKPS